MVDDRALVVGAQEDEPAVELDEVVVGEPLDLAVGDRFAVADHAPEIALSRENLGHERSNLPQEQAAHEQGQDDDGADRSAHAEALEHDSSSTRRGSRAERRERRHARGSDARGSEPREPPLESRRLGPGRNPALDRPERQLGDQEKPGRVHRGEPVERRALRREEHRVLAAERRQAEPERPRPAYGQAEGEQGERRAAEPEREVAQLEILRSRIRREAGRRDERNGSGR